MKALKLELITVCLIVANALCAQVRKVAVMETKVNEGVTSFQSNLIRGGMETAVTNAPGFEGYDRASFDMILQEQDFQRSGFVNEKQIREMGKMAGVQYVLVTEASTEQGSFYLLAKLLDVETGKFMATADKLCGSTPNEIQNACSELGKKLFSGNYAQNTPSKNIPRHNSSSPNEISIQVGNVTIEMVKVEAGEFTMGCTGEQGSSCQKDETPYHRVTITKDYYISKYEVTQILWQSIMGYNPSSTKDYYKPVTYVSWFDCVAFCSELSRQTGKNFRLPTEAEWEYAARGGNKSNHYKFSGSSNLSDVGEWSYLLGYLRTGGDFRPNELGIYDMSGNVWEWCSDWYGYYSSSSQIDPRGPNIGEKKVGRGGAYDSSLENCRVTTRGCKEPTDSSHNVGLRLVLEP